MELINSSIIIVVFQNFAKVKVFYCQTKQPRQNHLHCGQICKLPACRLGRYLRTGRYRRLGRYLQTWQIPTDLVDSYRLGRYLQTWYLQTWQIPTDLIDTYRLGRYLRTWQIPTDPVDTYRLGRMLSCLTPNATQQ